MDRLEQGNPWYVYYSGRMSGPISRHDTLRLASDGKLGPNDLVWTVGFPDWMIARDVQGLYKPPPLPPGLNTASSDAPTHLKSSTSRPPREDMRDSNRASSTQTRNLQPVKSSLSERTDSKTHDTNGKGSRADRPEELTEPTEKEPEDKPVSRVSAIAVAAKPDPSSEKEAAADADQMESTESTNDVREVLEALLSDSDEGASDKADLDSKKRKDGLLDQIVKRIRDNDTPAPRTVVMPKPETGKLPT